MNCPYCGEEMLLGSIYARNGLFRWVEKKKMTLWNNFKFNLFDIVASNCRYMDLSKQYSFGYSSCEAFYCDSCRKLIINTLESADYPKVHDEY